MFGVFSFFIRHNSAIDIHVDLKMTLPQQTRHIQDLEEPEAEAQVGPAATEGPHHRVLFPARDADKTDAAADDEADATDDAPGDRSEGGEEGSEAVDAGRTQSIHAKRPITNEPTPSLASMHHYSCHLHLH